MKRLVASAGLLVVLAGGFTAGRATAPQTVFQASYGACVASGLLSESQQAYQRSGSASKARELACEQWNAWQAEPISSDTGVNAVYDGCTYAAFVDHASPEPCYRYLPGVAR